jgi:hypothetical protein
MNNWNKSTIQSIKFSYSFLNKLFDSPSLRINSKVVSYKNDRVVPFLLTVSYDSDIGNFEDSVFEFLPGENKFITEIINVPREYPYRIKIDNPGNYVLQISVDTIKSERIAFPVNVARNNNYQINQINNIISTPDKEKKDNDVNIVFTNTPTNFNMQ